MPARPPLWISCRWTQLSKVCGTQPIFGAIDATAAHNDGYSPRCSCTIRTARSRTSGENVFVLFMAPFSQELEPPQIPGRSEEHTSELQSLMRISYAVFCLKKKKKKKQNIKTARRQQHVEDNNKKI